MVPNKHGILSDEWWVMSYEWWVMKIEWQKNESKQVLRVHYMSLDTMGLVYLRLANSSSSYLAHILKTNAIVINYFTIFLQNVDMTSLLLIFIQAHH